VPIPVRDAVVGEAALLLNVSEPVTVPLAFGVKETLYRTLCPAEIVNGKEAPSRTNWELLLASEETVTLAPLALNVMACVLVVPTVTSPKFTGAGATESFPAVVIVPIPLSGTSRLGPETKMLPPLVPADRGAKVECSVMLCPPFRVIGSTGPVTENPLPVIWKADIVTL
jgi:hypothetical protein